MVVLDLEGFLISDSVAASTAIIAVVGPYSTSGHLTARIGLADARESRSKTAKILPLYSYR
jgi:hypothetical protein